MVGGLVVKPGRIPIEAGGLTLRDAVSLANGDNPEKNFGHPAVSVFVTLERGGKVKDYSHPLVTNDLFGKIKLLPQDRITLRAWHETDLARPVATDNARVAALKRLPEDNEKEIKRQPNPDVWANALGNRLQAGIPAEYKIPLTNLGGEIQMVTVQASLNYVSPLIEKNGFNLKIVKRLGDKLNGEQDQTNRLGLPTLMGLTTQNHLSPPEETIIVLTRSTGLISEDFILPRHVATQSNPDQAMAKEVLENTYLLPGDSVAIETTLRLPEVLLSLAVPEVFDPTRRDKKAHPFLKNHKGLKQLGKTLETLSLPGQPLAAPKTP